MDPFSQGLTSGGPNPNPIKRPVDGLNITITPPPHHQIPIPTHLRSDAVLHILFSPKFTFCQTDYSPPIFSHHAFLLSHLLPDLSFRSHLRSALVASCASSRRLSPTTQPPQPSTLSSQQSIFLPNPRSERRQKL